MYDADVQKVIKSRVGDMEADAEADAGEQSDIIGPMAKKYGLASDNMANIRTALENDDMFWEEAAADQGMAVDSYKKMMKLEVENESFRKAKGRGRAQNQRDAVFQKWDREAEELKRFYPQFDLQTEIQDQRFLDLMGAGINMRTIYETLHHDEIIPALMQQTAKATAKQQAAAVQERSDETGGEWHVKPSGSADRKGSCKDDQGRAPGIRQKSSKRGDHYIQRVGRME